MHDTFRNSRETVTDAAHLIDLISLSLVFDALVEPDQVGHVVSEALELALHRLPFEALDDDGASA